MGFQARKHAKICTYTSLSTLRDSWMSGLSMYIVGLVIVIGEGIQPTIRVDGKYSGILNFSLFYIIKKRLTGWSRNGITF
jgi:hypothetical protein